MIRLLIIDPQVDFVEKAGSIPAKDAKLAIKHINHFIEKFDEKIDEIYITMDIHYRLSIFHPLMWQNQKGNQPIPGTIISSEDVNNFIWIPKDEWYSQANIKYINDLEKIGKKLVIKPYHCIMGSKGSNICDELLLTINDWEEDSNDKATRILRGMNQFTEHSSIFKADIEMGRGTDLRVDLLETFREPSLLFICGTGLDTTIKNSVLDLLNYFAGFGTIYGKICIITNCVSYYNKQESTEFLEDMRARGVSTKKIG